MIARKTVQMEYKLRWWYSLKQSHFNCSYWANAYFTFSEDERGTIERHLFVHSLHKDISAFLKPISKIVWCLTSIAFIASHYAQVERLNRYMHQVDVDDCFIDIWCQLIINIRTFFLFSLRSKIRTSRCEKIQLFLNFSLVSHIYHKNAMFRAVFLKTRLWPTKINSAPQRDKTIVRLLALCNFEHWCAWPMWNRKCTNELYPRCNGKYVHCMHQMHRKRLRLLNRKFSKMNIDTTWATSNHRLLAIRWCNRASLNHFERVKRKKSLFLIFEW